MSAVLDSATVDSTSVSWTPNTGLASSFQIQVSFFGPINREWEFRQPLLITIEQGDDNSFIVSDQVFAMYGVGEQVADAIADYISALLEYYELLSLRRDEPSLKLFRRLQSYLQPVPR